MAKILSVLMSLAVALVLLTGSIALPILVRPFYYAHIEPLGLERKSGLSREEIVRAYDEVLDFCVGARSEFSGQRRRGRYACRYPAQNADTPLSRQGRGILGRGGTVHRARRRRSACRPRL